MLTGGGKTISLFSNDRCYLMFVQDTTVDDDVRMPADSDSSDDE